MNHYPNLSTPVEKNPSKYIYYVSGKESVFVPIFFAIIFHPFDLLISIILNNNVSDFFLLLLSLFLICFGGELWLEIPTIKITNNRITVFKNFQIKTIGIICCII